MGQHWSANTIANGVNAFNTCATLIIDDDKSAIVKMDTRIVRKQIIRVRLASYSNDQLVDFNRFRAVFVVV